MIKDMIDFDINPQSILIASERIEKDKKLEKSLKLCLTAGVCPICAEDLYVSVYTSTDKAYHCKSKTCSFAWPKVKKKLMFRP